MRFHEGTVTKVPVLENGYFLVGALQGPFSSMWLFYGLLSFFFSGPMFLFFWVTSTKGVISSWKNKGKGLIAPHYLMRSTRVGLD